jgi:hypothetical protein
MQVKTKEDKIMTLEEVQKKYAEVAIEVGHKIRQISELQDAMLKLEQEVDVFTQDLINLSKKGIELKQEQKHD